MGRILGILNVGDFAFMALGVGIALLIMVVGGYDQSSADPKDEDTEGPATPTRRGPRAAR